MLLKLPFIRSPGGLLCRFRWVGLRWGLRFCISNKMSATDAVAPWTHVSGEDVEPPHLGQAF